MPNVRFTRTELSSQLLSYITIKDCIEGEPAIKGMKPTNYPTVSNMQRDFSNQKGFINIAKAMRYLPKPNPGDESKENSDRYIAYVTRAVFYGATKRSLDGLAGQVFQRDPVVEIPALLEPLNKDADGSGIGLVQLSMRAVRTVTPYGRSGLFVDYPETQGQTTVKQLQDGDIRPVIMHYEPWDVINWDTRQKGARHVLSLVVLREFVNASTDEFQYIPKERFRVLRLDAANNYVQEIWETEDETVNAESGFSAKKTINVKDSKGNALNYIPFTFIGSENNDPSVDEPPMYDLSSLNIAHYRNSADYEESAFICGQATLTLIGLTEDWVANVLKGQVALGSRAAIPLPVGADAKMLQAEANNLPGEAMANKERQMVALGAKLVQQQMVQRTATESIMETSSETSILANVAKNVSAAFLWALGVCCQFVGADASTVKFELNTQFEINQMTADDRSKLISDWQKGAITFSEMRSVMRKAGIATLPDDEARAEIKKELTEMIDSGLMPDPQPAPAPSSGGSPNPNSNPAAHATKGATRGARA